MNMLLKQVSTLSETRISPLSPKLKEEQQQEDQSFDSQRLQKQQQQQQTEENLSTVKLSLRSNSIHQHHHHQPQQEKQISPSNSIQMIETMVDLRTNTSSRGGNRSKGTTMIEEGITVLRNSRKNSMHQQQQQRRSMISGNGRPIRGTTKRNMNESLINENGKRFRIHSQEDQEESDMLENENDHNKQEQQEMKLNNNFSTNSFQSQLHQHALAAAAVAQSLPIHSTTTTSLHSGGGGNVVVGGGKHSTTFEMIESRGDESQPDKIVRVHVISDRFSACIPCRRRKIRCMPSDSMPRPKSGTCGTCLRRNKTCVWTDDNTNSTNSNGRNNNNNNNNNGGSNGKTKRKNEMKDLSNSTLTKEKGFSSLRKRSNVMKGEEEVFHHHKTVGNADEIHSASTNSSGIISNTNAKSFYFTAADTSNLMDPPKFENINWAGMQYPPFYVSSSQMNSSLATIGSGNQGYHSIIDKHIYPTSNDLVNSSQSSIGSQQSHLFTPLSVSQPLLTSKSEGGYDLSFASQQQQYYQQPQQHSIHSNNHHHHHQIYQTQNYQGNNVNSSTLQPYTFGRAISLPTGQTTSTPTTVNTNSFNEEVFHNNKGKNDLSPSMSQDSPGSIPSTHFNTPLQTPNEANFHSQNKTSLGVSHPPSLIRAHSFHYIGAMDQNQYNTTNGAYQSENLHHHHQGDNPITNIRTMSIDASTFHNHADAMSAATASNDSSKIERSQIDVDNMNNQNGVKNNEYNATQSEDGQRENTLARQNVTHHQSQHEYHHSQDAQNMYVVSYSQVGNFTHQSSQPNASNTTKLRGASFSSNSLGEYISHDHNEISTGNHQRHSSIDNNRNKLEEDESKSNSNQTHHSPQTSTNNNGILDWSNSDLLPCSASNF